MWLVAAMHLFFSPWCLPLGEDACPAAPTHWEYYTALPSTTFSQPTLMPSSICPCSMCDEGHNMLHIVSESPTTRGVESDEKASSSVLGVTFGGNPRKNILYGTIRDYKAI